MFNILRLQAKKLHFVEYVNINSGYGHVHTIWYVNEFFRLSILSSRTIAKYNKITLL